VRKLLRLVSGTLRVWLPFRKGWRLFVHFSLNVNNWKEMIDKDALDVLFVSAPPSVHYEVAKYAIEHDIQTFIEKSPAESMAQLSELTELLKMHRTVKSFVGYNFIYSDTYKQLFAAVSQDAPIELAKIRFLTSKPQVPFWSLKTIEESYLMSIGIHALSITQDLFGDHKDITCAYKRLSDSKFALTVILAYDNANAIIDMGNYSNRFDYQYELVGQLPSVMALGDPAIVANRADTSRNSVGRGCS
jgi:phthalate 4,5-cis-dihydrodiol dehydrogenase